MQGEVFAAEGWGKCTGEVGVCIATSGPGATNLVTGLADALLDSVPLVAITGQVPRPMIGTDAFQETPIVEITRQITKHNYLVLDVADLPRIIKEAFYLARTGRPGPVLVDVPKDIQQQLHVPDWDAPMAIAGYMNRLPSDPVRETLAAVVDAIRGSERPVAYIGGGCLDSGEAITEFLDRTGIPVVQTLMGLGSYAASRPTAHGMLGMHGTVSANCAVDEADLLLAIGVRFDDRVTGKLETFAARARIVHIDIDPAEIQKNKSAHIPICADIRAAIPILNTMLEDEPVDPVQFAAWRDRLDEQRAAFPMSYPQRDDVIVPQWAIETLCTETKGEAIITTGVGQHQMWAAQWYHFEKPRHWVSSGGLGSMGFGLPSALGAAAAFNGTLPPLRNTHKPCAHGTSLQQHLDASHA
jgi:acetolactate synthase I/II/III large subunit